MLDLTTTFSKPNSIVTPFLRSFMGTFQVGIRNAIADSSAVHNMYVKAFDIEEAYDIAMEIIKPYDMIVKDIVAPGDEIYCEDNSAIADPLPVLRIRRDVGFGF